VSKGTDRLQTLGIFGLSVPFFYSCTNISKALEKKNTVCYNRCICKQGVDSVIKIKNHLGTIGVSTAYLRQLISSTAESCFGVAGLNAYGAKQGVSAMLKKENTTKGVIIRQESDEISVDLHITVTYGVNVGAITESIIHKVNFVLTEQAGVTVRAVNVFVDSMTD
jgi:uncharacterized alkaline shock family protein YloU